jgi:lysophospholipase L1-like esterase
VQFVAQIKGLTARNLACSRATTFQGVLGPQPTPIGDVPSQLWRAYQGPRPGKVVMTIAANDVNWTGFLQSCLGASNCATDANTVQFHQLLNKARNGVVLSMCGIEGLFPQDIYVTGYYDPFDGNVVTPAQLGFAPEEVAWYQARRGELNTMLQQTTQAFPRAHFVTLEFPHQSLTQLVQGPSDPAPFHPTVAGQQLIARSVAAAM